FSHPVLLDFRLTQRFTFNMLQSNSRRLPAFVRLLAIAVALLSAKLAIAETELVTRGIVATPPAGVRSVKVDGGYMVPYIENIPGTDVSFEMIPIPGGEFQMGSPPKEAHRKKDEGP